MIGARRWPLRGAPRGSVVIDGARFVRCSGHIAKPGVIAEFREDITNNSRHLYVYTDRSFDIDHSDRFNPDKSTGGLIAHAVADGGLLAFLKAVFSFRPGR